MDRITSTTLFLSVLKAALCFNIDPVAWKSLSNSAAGFGYQVVQRQSDLLVSAPLAQYSSSQRGKIFKCSTESCRDVSVPVPEFAVNMSLGLTMTSDPTTQNTLACGPTIPKECKSITLYSGLCLQIDHYNSIGPSMPSSSEECRNQADIAFLLDGSGSVDSQDFTRMKTFVKNLVRSFLGQDTQFAIAQFSSDPTIHYYFNTFDTKNWESQINWIRQLTGSTYTAEAIQHVVNNVFSARRGSRSDVKKILIVVTDGESHDRDDLPNAVNSAEKKKIVRFAIGVGHAFTKYIAKQELDTIASKPSANHVFQVSNFDALEKIRQNLQDKIFSIEGSQTGGESLKMEMAQEGFSAAYVPGRIQMGIVGANQWKGGYQQYTTAGQKRISYEPLNMEPDSYLGYSMAVAKTKIGTLTIVGAPRYQHRGVVISVFEDSLDQTIDPFDWQFQIGEYFGAVICTMDVDRDAYTDLVLISAPMYMDSDREGRVYVCSLSNVRVECRFDNPLVLRGDASGQGRFGSSLAVLPDLNGDSFNDLAVGAPLENGGQGSIYIFQGEIGGRGGRISPTYSQRIASSEVQSGLKFFGMSISQSSFDLSNDNLPDLAVGSKGTVVLLRSKPIVMVEAEVTFNPNKIQTQNSDCSKPLDNTARICFTMTRVSTVDEARAKINYTLTLDATREVPKNRAYIREKQREETGPLTLGLEQQCFDVSFHIEACPEDALNPIDNELRFIFDGLPSDKNLKPSLAQQAQTITFHPLPFEINCGNDNNCIDNLKVDFNFTSSSGVKVGIDELLEVTVSVENREENSYNSHVIVTYPPGLSYRKFTGLQGRIECNSLDSGAGLSQGKTDCTIDKPIFKSNTKALFIVSYGIESNSQLDRKLFITVNATSGNQHSKSSELYKMKGIDVKYSIFMTIESSLSYSNFTYGKSNLQKQVQQLIKVVNDIRALNFTVVIRVPVKLGDKDIWVDSSSLQAGFGLSGSDEFGDTVRTGLCHLSRSPLQGFCFIKVFPESSYEVSFGLLFFKLTTASASAPKIHKELIVTENPHISNIPDCQRDKDEKPTVTNFVAQIQKNKSVDCSVASCRVFKCHRFMGTLESKKYTISANLSSGWIKQIGLVSAKLLLTSTASLEYDRNQYIFYSVQSNNNPPIYKIVAEVEVYPEPDFTKEIVGGSLGGLVLLALLTAGLYKAGFFKSKYKEMINEGETADPGVEGGEPAPE